MVLLAVWRYDVVRFRVHCTQRNLIAYLFEVWHIPYPSLLPSIKTSVKDASIHSTHSKDDKSCFKELQYLNERCLLIFYMNRV